MAPSAKVSREGGSVGASWWCFQHHRSLPSATPAFFEGSASPMKWLTWKRDEFCTVISLAFRLVAELEYGLCWTAISVKDEPLLVPTVPQRAFPFPSDVNVGLISRLLFAYAHDAYHHVEGMGQHNRNLHLGEKKRNFVSSTPCLAFYHKCLCGWERVKKKHAN